MPVRSNRYFNDPMIGAAASNLAAAFAPPSPQDTAAWAKAGQIEDERARTKEGLRALSQHVDPRVSAMFQVDPAATIKAFPKLGLFTSAQDVYNSGGDIAALDPLAYAVFGDYGNTAGGEREGFQNVLDEERITQAGAMDRERLAQSSAMQRAQLAEQAAMQRQLMEVISLGQNETAYLPPARAAATGLPGTLSGNVNVGEDERTLLPTGGVFEGHRSAPSETEVLGAILQGLPANEQRAAALGDVPVEQILSEGGPEFAFRPDAVGQTPVPDTSRGTPKNYITPEGSFITYDGVTDAQTGQPLPPGGFIGNVEGGAGDVGLTTSTQSAAQQSEIASQKFVNLLGMTEELARRDPTNFGLPGFIKGVAQDVTAVADGLAQGLGFSGLQEAARDVQRDAIRSGVNPALLPGVFDPSLPALETSADLLVYHAAAALASQQGRAVSDKDIQQFKRIVGDPSAWTMSQQRFLAKLNQLGSIVGVLRDVDQQALGRGSTTPPPATPQPSQPPAPSGPPAVPLRGMEPSGGQTIQTPDGPVTIRRLD